MKKAHCRGMSDYLGDALSQDDAHEQWKAQQEENVRREEHVAVQRFAELVEDFLRRMAVAGNPGLNWELKDGLFRRIRGWALTYDSSSDRYRRLPIRVDGLVPGPGGPKEYGPPRQSGYALSDKQLKTLAASMAEVMHSYGVS